MVRAQCDLSQEELVNDLRGNSALQEVHFGIKNKLIGVVLVAAVMCVVGVFFLTSTPTTAAQPLVAQHGPSAVQTQNAQ